MITFKDYYNKNKTSIPNIIFVLVWNIFSTSDKNILPDDDYLWIWYANPVRDINQLHNVMDETTHFNSSTKIKYLMKGFLYIMKIFMRHRFFYFLQNKKINLKECIEKTRKMFPGIRNQDILCPVFLRIEELRTYIDMLCKTAIHELYVRHCGLFIRMHMKKYHDKFMVSHDLIVKNKKEGKPDQIMTIYYHSIFDEFWVSALSSKFSGSFENDKYIVYTNKENTSQEAVSLICMYSKNRREGLRYIENEFYRLGEGNYDEFEKWIQRLYTICDKWFYHSISDLINNLFIQYIEDTLGASYLKSSFRKMELFVTKNKNIARYIWETNYNTEKDRVILAIKADVGKKMFNGFIKSQTITDLEEYIEKKSKMNRTIYDDLPPDMKKKIKDAEYNLLSARRGSRVGWFGLYISSEEINKAENNLKDLWKNADRYISKNKTKY